MDSLCVSLWFSGFPLCKFFKFKNLHRVTQRPSLRSGCHRVTQRALVFQFNFKHFIFTCHHIADIIDQWCGDFFAQDYPGY